MVEYRRLSQDPSEGLSEMLELVDEEARRADTLLHSGKPHFYRQFFTPKGAVWGAFEDGALAGFVLLGFHSLVPPVFEPAIERLHLDKRACGAIRSTMVKASMRGRGIGPAMQELMFSEVRTEGVEHLFATIHPENVGSLQMVFKQGFEVADQITSYKSSGPRVVVYKSLVAKVLGPDLGDEEPTDDDVR